MRTIYIVTHPEATHHVAKLVGGWHDSELTPRGRKAAAAIAETLRAKIPGESAVDLFSSDLRRAGQTAEEIAARLDVKPRFDRRLREMSFGEAEGRPQEWMDERYIPPPPEGDRMGHDQGVPGAETRTALAQRVYAAMDDVLARQSEHQIIVTHGVALTFVVASWIKMPIEALGHAHFPARSGSITMLHEDDYFRSRNLVKLGDTAHLD